MGLGFAADSGLLGCDAVLLSSCCSTFWWNVMLSKHHESLWHIVTSQKAWILSYTTVESSELAKNETPVWYAAHSQRMNHLFDIQYTHSEKSTQMNYSSYCSVRKELIYVKDPGNYAFWKLTSSVADNFLTKISSISFLKYYLTFFTLYVTLKISCCCVTDLLCT